MKHIKIIVYLCMKKYLFIVVMLLSATLKSQTIGEYLKANYATIGLMYAAGVCNGQIEVLRHHYPQFKSVHPNVNDQFWNPAISHTNKYKNGDINQGEKFFMSSTALVPLTDAYHAIRFVERACIVGAVCIPISRVERRKKRLVNYVIDFTVHWVSFGAGFYTTYGLIYK